MVIVTDITAAIGPYFLTGTMLEVMLPIALVPCSVHVSVNAITISFILEPFALKYITVNVPELPTTACLIELPEAFVACAIRPYLDTEAMLHVAKPLPFVHSAVFEYNVTPLLNHLPL